MFSQALKVTIQSWEEGLFLQASFGRHLMLSRVSGDINSHHSGKCCLTEFSAINLFTTHNKKILVSDYENTLFLLSSSSPLLFYHVDTVYELWMCMQGECVCMCTCMWVYLCSWGLEITIKSFLRLFFKLYIEIDSLNWSQSLWIRLV